MIINFREYRGLISSEEFKEMVLSIKRQMSYGDLVENNLLNMMEDYSDINNIRVDKTSDDYDIFFGADAKVFFHNPYKELVDNMSTYIDITVNPNKKNISYYTGFNKLSRERVVLGELSNGLELSIGIKFANAKFKYKKPVVTVIVAATGFINPIFNKDDINKIVNEVRRACYFTSYRLRTTFGNEAVEGCGKRASDVVEVSDTSYLADEIAATINKE